LRRILKSFPSAASVSNYRPAIAHAVIGKFAPEGGTVVDFAAGYGGRLLGAIAANCCYIGIEPNKRQIVGFRRMQRAIRAQRFECPQTQFLHGPAEYHLPRFPARSADLVFSSPPFFDWERYSNDAMQSFKRYPRYEEWRAEFLEPVISDSFRILRRRGYLVLNATNGNRRPDPSEVKAIAEASGFTTTATYRMAFPKIPYLHPRNGKAVKHEFLLVFQK
jgi:tRNA1(Val) A37 N6-methylase TrmN6